MSDEQVLQGIRLDWQAQLGRVVIDLPSFEQALEAFISLLDDISR